MSYPGDHSERCALCGKPGGAAPEPGFMLLFRPKSGKRRHVHVFCTRAIALGRARSRRWKKLGQLAGVCGGLADDPDTLRRTKSGEAFLAHFIERDLTSALNTIGVCDAEIDNATQSAARRINKYPLS